MRDTGTAWWDAIVNALIASGVDANEIPTGDVEASIGGAGPVSITVG